MMYFPDETEIDVVLNVTVRGVTIFADVECIAHIEYGTTDGEIDYHITGFGFKSRSWIKSKWVSDGSTIITKETDGAFFEMLMTGIDDDYIVEKISGNYSSTFDSDSGLCNNAWVAS